MTGTDGAVPTRPAQQPAPPGPTGRPGRSLALAQAVAHQRRTVILAIVLAAVGLWLPISFGRWEFGIFLAVGILLGLANALLTEMTLLRSIASGRRLSRRQYATSALFRLLAVAVVGLGLTVGFWPNGAAVLFGLAFFHLIVLVLTGIPLLKELRRA